MQRSIELFQLVARAIGHTTWNIPRIRDGDRWRNINLRYVKYDIDRTAELIEKKVFPKYNAERLYQNWVEVLS